MVGRVGDLPASLDVGVLGKTMLEAARAAHIGVTVTVYEESGPRMVYVNEAAAEIVGWSAAEILASDPLANIAPEELPRIRERLAKRTQGEPGQTRYEVTVIRKDGRRVPVEMTASPTTLDGRPAMFAFIMDVSAPKVGRGGRACVPRLASASSSRARRSPSASSGEAGSSTRTEPTCPSSATRQRRRSTRCRWRSSSIPRRPSFSACTSESSSRRTGDRRRHTFRGQKYDGTVVAARGEHGALRVRGKAVGAHDGARRHGAEGSRGAARPGRPPRRARHYGGGRRPRDQQSARVRHAQPRVDRSQAAGVRGGPVEPWRRLADARRGAQGAERVATIVRELRSFSRADGETRRHVDLVAVVAVGDQDRRLTRFAIAPASSTSFEPARPVWANEARLEQVVINLLLNAAQAMREAHARGTRSACRSASDGEGRAVLEVSDNGDGIPADVLPRIFDPFFTTKPVAWAPGSGFPSATAS